MPAGIHPTTCQSQLMMTLHPHSYVVCLFGFKFSLLMSYLRFIPFGFCNAGTKCMGVAVTVAHVAFVLCFTLSCNPVCLLRGRWVLVSHRLTMCRGCQILGHEHHIWKLYRAPVLHGLLRPDDIF